MLIKIDSYDLASNSITLLLSDDGITGLDISGLNVSSDFTDMLTLQTTTGDHSAAPVILTITNFTLGAGDPTAGDTGKLIITYTDPTPAVDPTTDIIYLKQGSSVKKTLPLSGIINTASIDETLTGDGTTATTPTKMLAGIGTDQAGTGHKLTIRLMSADGTAISSEEVTLANSFMINDTKVAYINLITDITGPITSDGLFDFTVTYYNAANEELILLNSSTAALTAYLTRA